MNMPMPAAPVSPLRQRLIDDMNMRRFPRETQRNYIRMSDALRRSWGARPIRRLRITCAGSRLTNAMPACRCRP